MNSFFLMTHLLFIILLFCFVLSVNLQGTPVPSEKDAFISGHYRRFLRREYLIIRKD